MQRLTEKIHNKKASHRRLTLCEKLAIAETMINLISVLISLIALIVSITKQELAALPLPALTL